MRATDCLNPQKENQACLTCPCKLRCVASQVIFQTVLHSTGNSHTPNWTMKSRFSHLVCWRRKPVSKTACTFTANYFCSLIFRLLSNCCFWMFSLNYYHDGVKDHTGAKPIYAANLQVQSSLKSLFFQGVRTWKGKDRKSHLRCRQSHQWDCSSGKLLVLMATYPFCSLEKGGFQWPFRVYFLILRERLWGFSVREEEKWKGR